MASLFSFLFCRVLYYLAKPSSLSKHEKKPFPKSSLQSLSNMEKVALAAPKVGPFFGVEFRTEGMVGDEFRPEEMPGMAFRPEEAVFGAGPAALG